MDSIEGIKTLQEDGNPRSDHFPIVSFYDPDQLRHVWVWQIAPGKEGPAWIRLQVTILVRSETSITDLLASWERRLWLHIIKKLMLQTHSHSVLPGFVVKLVVVVQEVLAVWLSELFNISFSPTVIKDLLETCVELATLTIYCLVKCWNWENIVICKILAFLIWECISE